MTRYIHEFKVRMVVETKSPKKAEAWLDARLSGGDADFHSMHVGVTGSLTRVENEDYEETGELPARFGDLKP